MGLYDYRADQYVLGGVGEMDADTVYNVVFANLPQQINMTQAALTAEIRKVMPGYQFNEGTEADIAKRKEQSENARHKIAEVSAAQKTGLRAEGGKIVQKRGLGGAMALYVNKHPDRQELTSKYNAVFDVIKQEEALSAPIKGKDAEAKAREAERKAKLKELSKAHIDASEALRITILEDVADHMQDLYDRFSKMSTDELLENFDEMSAIRGICDTPNTLVSLKDTIGKEKVNDLLVKLDPLTALTDRLLTKMNVLASPIGHMVDPDQLLKMSKTQINALHDVTKHIFDIGEVPGKTPTQIASINESSAQHNIFLGNNLGLAFSPVTDALGHKAKAAMGIDLTAKENEEPMQVFDLFGNSVSDPIFECRKGMPVFYVSQKHPEKDPVLAFERDGRVFAGEEALAEYQKQAKAPQFSYPEEPAPYNPGIFQSFWDSIVEFFGGTSARMQHEKEVSDHAVAWNAILAKNTVLKQLHNPKSSANALRRWKNALKDKVVEDYRAKHPDEPMPGEKKAEKGEPVKAQPQTEEKQPEKVEEQPQPEKQAETSTVDMTKEDPQKSEAQPQTEEKQTEEKQEKVEEKQPQTEEKQEKVEEKQTEEKQTEEKQTEEKQEKAPKNDELSDIENMESVKDVADLLASTAENYRPSQIQPQVTWKNSMIQPKEQAAANTAETVKGDPQQSGEQPQTEEKQTEEKQEKPTDIDELMSRTEIENMELDEDPEDLFWKIGISNQPMKIQISAGNAAKEIKESVAARKDIGSYEKTCYGFAIRRLESINRGDLRPTKELDNTVKTSLLSIAGDKILGELSKYKADKTVVEQARKLENMDLLRTVSYMPTFRMRLPNATGEDLIEWAKHDFSDFKSEGLRNEFKEQLSVTLNKDKSKVNDLSNQLTNNQPTISQPQKGIGK